MAAGPAGFRFGIEAEFALVDADGTFRDFTNLTYEQVQRVVDRLPDDGDPELTRGDLAVKLTRWYVEGDERFDEQGRFSAACRRAWRPVRRSGRRSTRRSDSWTCRPPS